jgi:ABC-type lipoprotein export system ATPase subunit
VLDIFDELHKNGQTIIMVTHEMEYGKRAEKIIKIDDGQVVG